MAGKREYRVWAENGDLIHYGADKHAAESAACDARQSCPCGTNGGDGECGVIHSHGISVQVVENGEDVTQDYLING